MLKSYIWTENNYYRSHMFSSHNYETLPLQQLLVTFQVEKQNHALNLRVLVLQSYIAILFWSQQRPA